jgi:hypothetical protein
MRADPVQILILGLPWDATFAAALIAALVGLASLIVSGVAARWTRDLSERTLRFQRDAGEREQFRGRLELALTRALSPDLTARKVGLVLLRGLLDDEWASARDRELVLAVAIELDDHA